MDVPCMLCAHDVRRRGSTVLECGHVLHTNCLFQHHLRHCKRCGKATPFVKAVHETPLEYEVCILFVLLGCIASGTFVFLAG